MCFHARGRRADMPYYDMTDVRSLLSRRSFLTCSTAALVALSSEIRATGKGLADGRLPTSLKPLVETKRWAILAALQKDDIPGGAVAWIYEGKLVWTEGFGVTDRASARPVDPHTIFSVFSRPPRISPRRRS
jgi:CubicO group peptidase (beta-lactamase class C family)